MTDGFEREPSHIQELTFGSIWGFVREYMGPRGHLGTIQDETAAYNNYALMLSDQCEHHIVLRAEGKETALDGPLPVQMEECLQRIAKLNPSVKLSNRIAMYKKFPPTAIREALVNSLIHFDASKGDRILVTVGDSLLKVDSPGSVYVPMDQDSPFVRNALMGEFLVNAGYANLKGRGLQTMKTSYRTSGMLPSISRSNGHFVVNLPSLT